MNSLCSLALSQAEDLAKKKQLQLGLAELKWAYVLPMFWLIDDYMFRNTNAALNETFPSDPRHDSLLLVLRAYYFLIREPLANIDEQIRILTEMKFECLGDGNQCEDFVLLTHLLELVWFHGPIERWQTLADDWIKRAPQWCNQVLQGLGFQLLSKLGDPVAPVLAKWIHNSVLSPEPTAIPIMIYVGIPAAIRLPAASRTDLLSVCQSLLAHLLLRHRTEPDYGHTLAVALSDLGQLMRRQEHPLVRWDTEAAEQSLNLLVPKFSLVLMETSKSTNPDVRAMTARFLRNLEEWMKLPPPLQQTIDKLIDDNRARVRFQARPRTKTQN